MHRLTMAFTALKYEMHISVASFVRDICKRRHLIRVSTVCLKNGLSKMNINTTQQPLKRKWTGPIDKSGFFLA